MTYWTWVTVLDMEASEVPAQSWYTVLDLVKPKGHACLWASLNIKHGLCVHPRLPRPELVFLPVELSSLVALDPGPNVPPGQRPGRTPWAGRSPSHSSAAPGPATHGGRPGDVAGAASGLSFLICEVGWWQDLALRAAWGVLR